MVPCQLQARIQTPQHGQNHLVLSSFPAPSANTPSFMTPHQYFRTSWHLCSYCTFCPHYTYLSAQKTPIFLAKDSSLKSHSTTLDKISSTFFIYTFFMCHILYYLYYHFLNNIVECVYVCFVTYWWCLHCELLDDTLISLSLLLTIKLHT